MTERTEETTELVLVREVDADIEEVWKAWTTAEGLARWWWPHWSDTAYEIERRVGAPWSVGSVEGRAGVEGEVLTVEEPRLLELSWRWDGDATEDRVRVELDGHGRGTVVTVRHRTAGAGTDDYRDGWEFVLGNLASTVR